MINLNILNSRSLIRSAFFIGLLLNSISAFAQQNTPPFRTDEQKQVVERFDETIKQTKIMLAHVNLASVAIELSRYKLAKEHIITALNIANTLNPQSFLSIGDTRLRYGKITYEIEGKEQEFYLPYQGEKFSIERVRTLIGRIEPDRIKKTDANVVHSRISLDLFEIRKALEMALTLIEKENYNDTLIALRDVYKGALYEEKEIKYPLWAVHDNLKLAESLIIQKDYIGARFALESAFDALDNFKKEAGERNRSDEIIELQEQMTLLRKELQKMDPSIKQTTIEKFGRLAGTVRGWFRR